MRTVTREEAQKSTEWVHGMSAKDTRALITKMQKEQPFLQVYAAAVVERDFPDDNDADAFANLSVIVWHAMRKAAGEAFPQVSGDEIDRREAQMMELYRYAANEAEEQWHALVTAWMDGYNQRPLLEFILDALMSPENRYGVTPDGSGLIFTYLKVIVDCLDNAGAGRDLV
jgi:hypothetical protein